MKKVALIVGLVALVVVGAQSQVLLSSGYTYAQNFDSLSNSITGTTTPWADNSTLVGWYASRAISTSGANYGPFAYTSYRVNSGNNNSGWIHSLGTDSDRALGSVSSGTPGTNAIGLQFQNDTGTAWTGDVSISYTGEQWRNGGNTSIQSILKFDWTIVVGPFLPPFPAITNPPGWYPIPGLPVPGLDLISPTVGATATALDGNASANKVSLSATLTGITLNAGDELLLRWHDINDAGNDHGGGIDDLTVQFIPEPVSAALVGLGVLGLAFWRRRK